MSITIKPEIDKPLPDDYDDEKATTFDKKVKVATATAKVLVEGGAEIPVSSSEKVEAEELPKDELHLHSLDIEELSVEELSSEYPIYKEPPLTDITEVNLDDINISSGSLPITTMLSDNLSSDKMSTKGFKGVFIDLTTKGILVSTLSKLRLLK